jgi:transcriptional regulator with XRE-family HTH domain
VVSQTTGADYVRVPQAPRHAVLKRLGERVRQLRNQRGWSQEECADYCRVDRSYMSGIERGVRNVSVLHCVRLARGLRVSLSKLFEGVD